MHLLSRQQQSYVWRKQTERGDFPPGLADLIRDAYILVLNGAEYVGLYIHDEGKCWIGYRERSSGMTQSLICANPDEARKRAERMMAEGLIAPRRRSRV